MTGSLSILNVGAGDIEVVFNQHQPDEVARAIRMLLDMQKRGYAILVKQDDGTYTRAIAIDATRGHYIIAGEPEPALAPVDPTLRTGINDGPPMKARRGRPPKRRQPIATSHAVGVARSAGG